MCGLERESRGPAFFSDIPHFTSLYFFPMTSLFFAFPTIGLVPFPIPELLSPSALFLLLFPSLLPIQHLALYQSFGVNPLPWIQQWQGRKSKSLGHSWPALCQRGDSSAFFPQEGSCED